MLSSKLSLTLELGVYRAGRSITLIGAKAGSKDHGRARVYIIHDGHLKGRRGEVLSSRVYGKTIVHRGGGKNTGDGLERAAASGYKITIEHKGTCVDDIMLSEAI